MYGQRNKICVNSDYIFGRWVNREIIRFSLLFNIGSFFSSVIYGNLKCLFLKILFAGYKCFNVYLFNHPLNKVFKISE